MWKSLVRSFRINGTEIFSQRVIDLQNSVEMADGLRVGGSEGRFLESKVLNSWAATEVQDACLESGHTEAHSR